MSSIPSIGRRRAAGLVAAGLAAGGWAVLRHGRNQYQVRQERTLMQTSVSVTVLADSEDGARHAITAAFDDMTAVAAVLTRFDPRSAVSRLNRQGSLSDPPAHLRTVVAHALSLAAATDGDFDVTVAPVLDCYLGLGRPARVTPLLRQTIAGLEGRVGYRSLILDRDAVRFTRPGMGLTLDGIAKGYVVDQGIAALRSNGIEDALIDAGGDLRAIARPDGKRFWNVGIVDPQRTDRVAAAVRIGNAAVSTSGNYVVFFTADRRLFHIVDPHTGFSPDRYSSVTVVAPQGIEADATSTAAISMPPLRLKELMARRGNAWLVFSWDGARRWRSRDLPLIGGQAQVL